MKYRITYAYTWKGLSTSGEIITGQFYATQHQQFLQYLRSHSITLLNTKRQVHIYKPNEKDTQRFTKTLLSLLQTGIPVKDALDIINQQTNSPALRFAIRDIMSAVLEGQLLHQALSPHPLLFNKSYCQLIQLGEQTGSLIAALTQLDLQLTQRIQIKSQVQKALFYPSCVLLLSLIISGALLIYVIPQFQAMYSNAGSNLPAFTQTILAISTHLKHYAGYEIIACLFFTISFKYTLRYSSSFNHAIQASQLRLPIMKTLITYHAMQELSHGLMMGISAGASTRDALILAANMLSHPLFSTTAHQLVADIDTGCTLYQATQKSPHIPQLTQHLIHVAEHTGRLAPILAQINQYYTLQFRERLQSLTQLIEPLLMLILTAIVGSMIMAIYLPIFQLGELI